jgi:phosphate transport system substrate-binding protein
MNNADSLVKKEGSIPLSKAQYLIVENKLLRNVLGSSFAGDIPVGTRLSELLNRSIDGIKRPEFRN